MNLQNWRGRLICTILGFALGGPIGAIGGVILGYLFDMGYFDDFLRSMGFNVSSHSDVQKIFFDTTFSVMGYIAKSDGHVSQSEINMAKRIMSIMGLNASMKKEAIESFRQGKQANFNIAAALNRLRRACSQHPTLLRTFFDIQMQIAVADNNVLTQQKRQMLREIFMHFGISPQRFDAFEQQFRAGQQYQQRRQYSRPPPRQQQNPNDAYQVLGLTPAASVDEIKKAYRRLMSKNHPDKLIAKGLPPEMIKLATQKTQQIKNAYETIRKLKGF